MILAFLLLLAYSFFIVAMLWWIGKMSQNIWKRWMERPWFYIGVFAILFGLFSVPAFSWPENFYILSGIMVLDTLIIVALLRK